MKKFLFVLLCFALIHGRIIASEKEQISSIVLRIATKDLYTCDHQ